MVDPKRTAGWTTEVRMFDGFLPEALQRSCRIGKFFNLETKLRCRSAADSAMGNCGPNLWLLLLAARAGVLYDADQRYGAVDGQSSGDVSRDRGRFASDLTDANLRVTANPSNHASLG